MINYFNFFTHKDRNIISPISSARWRSGYHARLVVWRTRVRARPAANMYVFCWYLYPYKMNRLQSVCGLFIWMKYTENQFLYNDYLQFIATFYLELFLRAKLEIQSNFAKWILSKVLQAYHKCLDYIINIWNNACI